MIKDLCAVLFLFCSSFIQGFDFEYKNQDEFVLGIAECTAEINAYIPPQQRVVVIISVAQAALESDWGRSRFATEANNFYGIIQTDRTEPHIKSLKSEVILKTYGRRCESTADYVRILSDVSRFKEYRELRMKQVLVSKVNIEELIKTLAPFAADPFYTYKVRDTVNYLFEHYPDLFSTREYTS